MEKNYLEITSDQIITPELMKGAYVRHDFPGFKEDFSVIHCLIRKYKPANILEVGTSHGYGTRVLCVAFKVIPFISLSSPVYSIDVPPGTDASIIYPDHEDGHPKLTGKHCRFIYRYHQLFGDSRTFDYSPYYPLEAWFIDGKHDYEFCTADTLQALKAKPKLIIWHDLQIEGVHKAVVEVMVREKENYNLYRVMDTRIGFAVRKDIL
jgi:hypothetical protein